MFISKFAWILIKKSIFVGIISRIIGGFKEFSERIIGRFKSIIDLSLAMQYPIATGKWHYITLIK